MTEAQIQLHIKVGSKVGSCKKSHFDGRRSLATSPPIQIGWKIALCDDRGFTRKVVSIKYNLQDQHILAVLEPFECNSEEDARKVIDRLKSLKFVEVS